jgi:hypothetical protein
MSTLSRFLVSTIGILSIVLIAYVMFKPHGSNPEPSAANPGIEEELNLFLRDRMDYGVEFSRVLAQKRIDRAKEIARDHPEYEPRALTVIDSLNDRLDHRVKM